MTRPAPFRRRSLSLTSLIDVIFLLLLFFMLSTTFTRSAELPLVAAAAGSGPPQAAPVFLRLMPEHVTLNGQPAMIETLTRQIADLAQPDPLVLISLAPDVTAQRLADLLVQLRAAPGLHVQVLG
jgi:biopolymer transport protein ExbD